MCLSAWAWSRYFLDRGLGEGPGRVAILGPYSYIRELQLGGTEAPSGEGRAWMSQAPPTPGVPMLPLVPECRVSPGVPTLPGT